MQLRAGYLVIFVDDEQAPYKTGTKIPVDERHVHLSDGSSKYELSLPKGYGVQLLYQRCAFSHPSEISYFHPSEYYDNSFVPLLLFTIFTLIIKMKLKMKNK